MAGRIALWSRRLVGAALSEAQRVVEDRPALTHLYLPDLEGPDAAAQLDAIGLSLTRVIDRHNARMKRIQLEA